MKDFLIGANFLNVSQKVNVFLHLFYQYHPLIYMNERKPPRSICYDRIMYEDSHLSKKLQ
uniref:Uncharacterized protein n=1 Tax=Kalanchoe fedtschenkoi TaxID=63787 RepID=A0A7N0SVL0_KALFE